MNNENTLVKTRSNNGQVCKQSNSKRIKERFSGNKIRNPRKSKKNHINLFAINGFEARARRKLGPWRWARWSPSLSPLSFSYSCHLSLSLSLSLSFCFSLLFFLFSAFSKVVLLVGMGLDMRDLGPAQIDKSLGFLDSLVLMLRPNGGPKTLEAFPTIHLWANYCFTRGSN